MPERRSSLGWRATSASFSAHLISRPSAVSSPSCAGSTARPAEDAGQRRVDRAAVGDVDRQRPARGLDLDPAREHVGGDVAERDRRDRAALHPHARADPARRDVDRELDLAVHRRRDAPRLDRPRRERDRAVPARRREPVLVPEQHAQLGAGVVGLDEEAAVHVGVPARLVAEQPPHALGLRALERERPALGDRRARQLRGALEDDPERLAGRVVVRRAHLHGRGRYTAGGAHRSRWLHEHTRRRAPRAATARRRSAAARRRRRRTPARRRRRRARPRAARRARRSRSRARSGARCC